MRFILLAIPEDPKEPTIVSVLGRDPLPLPATEVYELRPELKDEFKYRGRIAIRIGDI